MSQFRNVLLVDDDVDDYDLFSEAVAVVAKDTTVYHASDGLNAMRLLDADQPPLPDVIFLDLNMPRKNGIEFLAEVKQREEYNAIPVIVYSTSANYKAETASLGAVHYMIKQHSFNELCQELGDVLSQRWG